jgi:16S rRNA (adenine1518-N6/adenine1519-N6)-dimethyltransferase
VIPAPPPEVPELPSERARLEAFGVQPRRRFGQNFLVDQRIAELIADRAGWPPQAPVVEIGAGGGALTRALLETGRPVWAVEIDRDLVRLLEERFAAEIAAGRLVVTGRDALELDAAALSAFASGSASAAPPGGGSAPAELWIAGNLPYTATTPLLLWTLRHAERLAGAVFMVQREYADRIVADPGSRTYGSITVFTRAHAGARSLLHVGRSSFWPRPGVESTVLELRFPHPRPFAGDVRALERVLRAAFGQRRKMLVNALAAGLGLPREETQSRVAALGLDPAARAERLDLKDFAALASEFADGPDAPP